MLKKREREKFLPINARPHSISKWQAVYKQSPKYENCPAVILFTVASVLNSQNGCVTPPQVVHAGAFK